MWKVASVLCSSLEVTDLTECLLENPRIANKPSYKHGWLIKMALCNSSQLDSLMSKKAHEEYVKFTEE
jgi:glycine cleavage system H lipoate-binding protein